MVTFREDGYALLLSERLWKQFLAALEAERSFAWDVVDSGGIREIVLRVEFSEHHSPFGEIYHTYEASAQSRATNHRSSARRCATYAGTVLCC
jgi:hypothetical protein